MVSLFRAVGDSPAAEPGAQPQRQPDEPSAPVTKQMFLKLLVTQIRYQNPLNPADGAEFLAQLAQFSGLEQMIAIRQELETIAARLEASAEPAAAGDSSG